MSTTQNAPKARIAINGFGRIGRITFRRMFAFPDQFEIVAVNDLTDPKELAYLLEFDSAQGRYMADKVKFTENAIVVDGHTIPVFAQKDPSQLPWAKLNIDLVVESTGFFITSQAASAHLTAGAKRVVISAPAKGDDVKTIVYNVNHTLLTANDKIISCASCTTNCLAPVAQVLHQQFKIIKGFMTTVHSATNDQRILDLPHPDPRRGRSGLNNIIPTSTGAAVAVSLVLPELKGRLDGIALRVPTVTGSIVDLTVELGTTTTSAEINAAMKKAASETLGYIESPIVSTDIIGETHGSIFDPSLTKVMTIDGKQLVKVFAWYDNEFSYVSQLVRTIGHFVSLK